MKRTYRILSILLAAAMLLPSQALAADIASKSQTQQPSIVINEVESDAPNKGNDWVEITNIGTETVNISGWYLTDDKGEERKAKGETTPLAEGTVLEPGAFLVFEETVNFDFGLGKADTAILYDADGAQIDSYAYTSVAVGTWSRRATAALLTRRLPKAQPTRRLPRPSRLSQGLPPNRRWCSTRSTPVLTTGWS